MDSKSAFSNEQSPPRAAAHAVRTDAWFFGAFGSVLLIYGWAKVASTHAPPIRGIPPFTPALWAVLPFAGLLLCIAIFPLIPAVAHWWDKNLNRLLVSAVFGAVTILYYLGVGGAATVATVLHHAILDEYIPFITLLLTLYVVSGGICLKGDLAAHPTTNTAFLAVGSIIASVVGTTGASMLLIRPLLQTNAERKFKTHTVVFFIFTVSNIGGSLLPVGDPPLFLGYLRGVPFLWPLNLWLPWACCLGVLLAVYFAWDTWLYRRESARDIRRDESEKTKLTLNGRLNFLWLAGIVLCAALVKPGSGFPGLGFSVFPYLREALMLWLAAASLWLTPVKARSANEFNYHAILEVAALFIGIFVCMQVPIEILQAHGQALGEAFDSPAKFFWATGVLSSFLDNAPTYAIFFETALSLPMAESVATIPLAGGGRISAELLTAISLGAVFMGANTYIGNGPNFMVKSIAEKSGVPMPSFFGYMLYSGGVLIPLFLLVSYFFLG